MKTQNAHYQTHPGAMPLLFDCDEPEHIHVQRESKVCKYWLTPLALGGNDGFSARELNQIRAQIALNPKTIFGGMA